MFRPNLGLRGIAVITAVSLGGGAVLANDQPYSANSIMPGCRQYLLAPGKVTDFYHVGVCHGAIIALSYISDNCSPAEVTNDQLVRVIVQYVDARPARMHENFVKLALEAVKAAWPCQR